MASGLLFSLTHSKSLRKVKGEDFVTNAILSPDHMGAQPVYTASVYLIADGHGPHREGQACAKFIASRFPELLSSLLPPDHEPSLIEEALCRAFLAVDEEWADLGDACDASGSTLTAVLVTESPASGQCLLTCASVGDSFSYVDTGRSIYELTANHRIDQNPVEAARLIASGCLVAKCGVNTPIQEAGQPGVGPRRVWPGGLVCARSIGDLEAAPEVLPVPHCRQVSFWLTDTVIHTVINIATLESPTLHRPPPGNAGKDGGGIQRVMKIIFMISPHLHLTLKVWHVF